MNTYKVNTSPAAKVTLTFNRKELWANFIKVWKDKAWDQRNLNGRLQEINEVTSVLLTNGNLLYSDVLGLFMNGYTNDLIGDAIKFFKNPNSENILREIHVVDNGGVHLVFRHEHILID